MVRVISVHHFGRQDVTSIASPPSTFTAAGNLVVLATQHQAVQVRELDKRGRLAHSFQTLDTVREVVYCPTGRYILTLEGDSAPAGVRVYVNWADPAVGQAPICPRIAGCVSPRQGDLGDRVVLDVIEFPLRDCPLQIAACSTTGNLMVAAANFLVVYKYVNKATNDNRDGKSNKTYMDFQECIHIFHNLVPTEIALSEDVVACLTLSEVHVFKVRMRDPSANEEDEERNLHSISLYSFNSTDLDSSGASSGAGGAAFARPSGVGFTSSDEVEEDTGRQPFQRTGTVGGQKKANAICNITLRRQQDSESSCEHSSHHRLDGCQGNVRRHQNEVDLSTSPESVPTVYLREVREANRGSDKGGGGGTSASAPLPRPMEETFGPAVGLTETAVKFISPALPAHEHQGHREDLEMECVTMLRCSLSESEVAKGERLRNLHLKPVFWREYRVRQKPGGNGNGAVGAVTPAAAAASSSSSAQSHFQHPLQSSLHPHLMSLTVCFTTQAEGHLYHLPGHLRRPGKGCGVHKVATYPFTSPVMKTALESTMLHALTDTGLESYTLKSGYSTVLEAEKMDGRTNACPPRGYDGHGDEENPVCLVGLRPFLGARLLQVSQAHLILLARADDAQQPPQQQEQQQGENEWTMYSLLLPTPTEVHRDILQLASMNRAASPHGYFQLLCESHMILRTSLRQLSWQQAVGANGAKDRYAQTKEKYLETCHLLGMHYCLSPVPSLFRLAPPYFRMSGRPAVACLHACLEEHFRRGGLGSGSTGEGGRGEGTLPPGILSYVEEIVLRPSAPSENVLDAGLADAVIDILGRYSVGTLAGLVIRSRGLREFKTRKTRRFLLEATESSRGEKEGDGGGGSVAAEMTLPFCLLSLDDPEDREGARRLLLRLGPSSLASLAAALIDHYGLLFEKSQVAAGFSELAIFLQESLPETFVEVLVSLIRGNLLPLSQTLALFLSALASSSSTTSPTSGTNRGQSRPNDATSTLQLFLETLFTEYLSEEASESEEEESELEPPPSMDVETEEALQTLVRSYLTSLSSPVRFGEKNLDADMFGNRLLCLDRLPPFQESAKEILDASSPEFWCQNSLLKLQSILSSPALATTAVKDTVLHFLDKMSASSSRVVGETSLRLLCCRSPSESVRLLCSSPHPSVLLPYARESPQPFEEGHWKLTLHTLQDHLASSHEEHPLHEAWYSAQQEVLDHLAHHLTLAEFIRVLPASAADEEFQGYIQMCRKNQQASDIQALIVNTGHKLLATLNF